MILARWKPAWGPADGNPAPRQPRPRPIGRLTLAALAMATLALDGCASDPCHGCGLGGIGNSVGGAFRRAGDGVRDATSRVFHHKKKAADCCDGGSAVEGTPIEGGVTSMPGSGGTIITTPPGAPGSTPMDETTPSILTPAPPGGSGGASSGGTKSSSVGPAGLKGTGNRQTYSSRPRTLESEYRGRGDNLARAALVPSVGTSPAAGAADGPSASRMLDNLPQVVDLSRDVARRGQASPVPPEAELVKPPSDTAARPKSSAIPTLKATTAPDPTLLTPGLSRFAAVKPQVSGGSLPNLDGLDWLKEKGIRTLIDLRGTDEVDRKFVDQAKSRGFQYLALPVVASKLDPIKVGVFGEEVAQADLQPVYFFDADGTRAGLVWYVHRLTVDKVDGQLASREAEELGLLASDKPTWQAAARYLDTAKPADSPPAVPAPDAGAARPEKLPASKTPSARGETDMLLTGLRDPIVDSPKSNVTAPASPSGPAR